MFFNGIKSFLILKIDAPVKDEKKVIYFLYLPIIICKNYNFSSCNISTLNINKALQNK